MVEDKIFNGRILVDSRNLDRDESGYLYYNGELFTGIVGYYRNNNTLSSYSEFVDGIPDGKSEAWFESGKKKGDYFYQKGCIVGTYKEWYESGQLKKETSKESPVTYISKEWYESGLMKSEIHLNKLKTLILKEWDVDGNIIKDFKA